MKAAVAELDQKIVDVLLQGPLRTSELAKKVGAKPEVVARHCRRLKQRHKVIDFDRQDHDILAALNGNGGTLSTAEIAKETGLNRDKVYRRCRRIGEANGSLSSQLAKSGRQLFFFPTTGQVVTADTYKEIRKTLLGLQQIARRHGLPRGAQIPPAIKAKMRREYRAYFRGLVARAKPEERERIRAFERRLMVVLNGTTEATVAGFVGVRSFPSKERRWSARRSFRDWLDDLIVALEGGTEPGDVVWSLLGEPRSVRRRRTQSGGKTGRTGDQRERAA